MFEFGVGTGADLEFSESLVGNVGAGVEDADRDPDPLLFEAEVASDGVIGGGVEKRRVYLVRDVAFEAAHDVACGLEGTAVSVRLPAQVSPS